MVIRMKKEEKCPDCGILFACPKCNKKMSEIDQELYTERRKQVKDAQRT